MPRPSKSSNVQPFSVREFFERFPTEDACLEHLMELRYGLRHPCDKCLHLSTFHRLAWIIHEAHKDAARRRHRGAFFLASGNAGNGV